MSNLSDTISRTSELTPHAAPSRGSEAVVGALGARCVEQARNQTSTGWFILAMAVGSLVVIGASGFNTIGLLQSHGMISLPQSFQWFASTIGLWTIAVVGVVIGGSLIVFGFSKIYTKRKEEREAESAAAEKKVAEEKRIAE